jgi:hypothetical protein
MQAKLDELVALSKPVTRQFVRPNPFAASRIPSSTPQDSSMSEAVAAASAGN